MRYLRRRRTQAQQQARREAQQQHKNRTSRRVQQAEFQQAADDAKTRGKQAATMARQRYLRRQRLLLDPVTRYMFTALRTTMIPRGGRQRRHAAGGGAADGSRQVQWRRSSRDSAREMRGTQSNDNEVRHRATVMRG